MKRGIAILRLGSGRARIPLRQSCGGRVSLLYGGLTPIIVLGALVAGGAWVARASLVRNERREAAAEKMNVATVRAAQAKFQVSVPVVGQLAAVNSRPAMSEVSGQIVRIVPNGAEVKEGDVIAVLDAPRMLRNVREQERQYQQALDQLRKKMYELAAGVQRAGLKVAQTQGELEQYQAQQKVELSQTRSKKEKDEADLALARQRFEREKKLAAEGLKPGREVELAEAQLKQQEFALERETKELELAEAKNQAEELNRQATVREAEAELGQSQSQQEAEVAGAEALLSAHISKPSVSARRRGSGGGVPRELRQATGGGGGGRGNRPRGGRRSRGLPPLQAIPASESGGMGSAVMEVVMRKTQLERVREEFGKATIKAPANGIVVLEKDWAARGGNMSRPLQAGDRAWEGRPIATVADLSEMRVDIELDQEQARQVKLKQSVLITVDAVPGITFEGKVTEISETANESTLPHTGIPSGERTFQAKITIKDLKKAKLRPGMSGRANIIVETLAKAVSVPLECVFEKDDRQVVYVRKGESFTPVEVELGPRTEDSVVISKGLKGGEELALRDVREIVGSAQ